jgi:alpha-tubulin suppressor-like RCC1 family protein
VSGGLSFDAISAGEVTTCGVTTTSVAYCWGDNEYGQLGTGDYTSSAVPVKVARQP